MRVKREDILYWDGKTWRTLESRVTSVDDEAMVFDEEEAPNWEGEVQAEIDGLDADMSITRAALKRLEVRQDATIEDAEDQSERLDALEAAVKRLWVMDKDIIDLYTGKGGK